MFFEQIKKDIFPEWDKKDEWRVKNLKNFKDDSKHINSNYLGRCDSTGKIIYLNLDPEDWKIEMLMVHEIAMLKRVANFTKINGRKKCKKLPTDANPSGTFVLRTRYVTKLKNY